MVLLRCSFNIETGRQKITNENKTGMQCPRQNMANSAEDRPRRRKIRKCGKSEKDTSKTRANGSNFIMVRSNIHNMPTNCKMVYLNKKINPKNKKWRKNKIRSKSITKCDNRIPVKKVTHSVELESSVSGCLFFY